MIRLVFWIVVFLDCESDLPRRIPRSGLLCPPGDFHRPWSLVFVHPETDVPHRLLWEERFRVVHSASVDYDVQGLAFVRRLIKETEVVAFTGLDSRSAAMTSQGFQLSSYCFERART